MEILSTAGQMREMDQEAMHGRYAIAPAVLMENAGRAVVVQVSPYIDGWRNKQTVILCGTGNNGGDGFVIARHIINEGGRAIVYILGQYDRYSDESQQHLKTLEQLVDLQRCRLVYYTQEGNQSLMLSQDLSAAQIVVDALIGTGFHGSLRNPAAGICNQVNQYHHDKRIKVVAVDIPSGVNADTGAVCGEGWNTVGDAIHADVTVTFGHRKRGLSLYPGREYSGKVVVDTIGMPWPLLEQAGNDQVFLLDDSCIMPYLPPRRPDSHKGTYGTVAIIAGSSAMAGAAIMACRGALRSGAGKICLRTPGRTATYCIGRQPEVMVQGIGTGDYFREEDALPVIKESSQWSVLALGPGIGRKEETQAFVKAILAGTACPLILDADALYALAGEQDQIALQGSRIIMTPHLGEFSRLSGLSVSQIQSDILAAAKKFAAQWRVTLVLKGAATVIASGASPNLYINTTGNAGMAAGGMGDILTGMTAALAVRPGIGGLRQAACAAVYLHGAAGDCCQKTIGPYGYSPLELADMLPAVYQELEQRHTLL